MNKLFLDTETCGFTGPIILIQYAEENFDPQIHSVWNSSVRSTLNLIERIVDSNVIGFNLAFDWFHIVKLYNLFRRVDNTNKVPNPNEIADISKRQPREYFLKPVGALDLWLHLRKTSYQSLMDRDNIKITKVPRAVAQDFIRLLRRYVILPDIYFHKRKDGCNWEIKRRKDSYEFVDIELKFGSTTALKPIISHIFKQNVLDLPIPKEIMPEEEEYNPYSTNWLYVINRHISIWEKDKVALKYAYEDVWYLQRLYEHFGTPDLDDVDSNLAICVANVRWHGLAIDATKVKEKLNSIHSDLPINFNSHVEVRRYLQEVASPIEALAIKSTGKKVLQSIAKLQNTQLAERCRRVLEARSADKQRNILEKLLEINRFCPVFKVIGAKSGRMSGGNDSNLTSLNPQGIPRNKEFRKLFTFADRGYSLSGGDFREFEVTLMDAAYKSEALHNDLLSGKKVHGVFGSLLYDKSYEEIMATKGTDNDLYTKAKSCVFAMSYGAEADKIAETANVSKDKAITTRSKFLTMYKEIGERRKQIEHMFKSLHQIGDVGGKIIYNEPADYIESILGFRRYFTLENSIVEALVKAATNASSVIKTPGHIKRRDRYQSYCGAVSSALYAASFGLQNKNVRAAINHEIQSSGAEICKKLQSDLWDIQPTGICQPTVLPLNFHDEVMVVHLPEVENRVAVTVQKTILFYRPTVPLLNIDWEKGMVAWGIK